MFILYLFCELILIVTCLKMVYDVNEEYEYTPLGQHFKMQCEVLKKTLIYKISQVVEAEWRSPFFQNKPSLNPKTDFHQSL